MGILNSGVFVFGSGGWQLRIGGIPDILPFLLMTSPDCTGYADLTPEQQPRGAYYPHPFDTQACRCRAGPDVDLQSTGRVFNAQTVASISTRKSALGQTLGDSPRQQARGGYGSRSQHTDGHVHRVGDESARCDHAFANRAGQQADLWHVRITLGNVYLESGNYVEAFGEFQACRDRIGESLSIYLNDRPTFRMLGKLEAAMDTTDRGLRASLVE